VGLSQVPLSDELGGTPAPPEDNLVMRRKWDWGLSRRKNGAVSSCLGDGTVWKKKSVRLGLWGFAAINWVGFIALYVRFPRLSGPLLVGILVIGIIRGEQQDACSCCFAVCWGVNSHNAVRERGFMTYSRGTRTHSSAQERVDHLATAVQS